MRKSRFRNILKIRKSPNKWEKEKCLRTTRVRFLSFLGGSRTFVQLDIRDQPSPWRVGWSKTLTDYKVTLHYKKSTFKSKQKFSFVMKWKTSESVNWLVRDYFKWHAKWSETKDTILKITSKPLSNRLVLNQQYFRFPPFSFKCIKLSKNEKFFILNLITKT